MIRDICRDETFLAQRAERAGLEDLETARDLLDTLAAHKESCVGMAANMIGVNKRIIVSDHQGAVAERKAPDPAQDLYRLDGGDHPARDRPLRRHPHLKGSVLCGKF